MDSDLNNMSREELLAELIKLRSAVRVHRDSTGHDLCWHHPDLWNLLPEKSSVCPVVPEWPVFLRGCLQYRQSLDEQLPDAPRSCEEFYGIDGLNIENRRQYMSKIDGFFARYEEGANSFDPDLAASLYTAEFMAGDPNGVSCGRNDQAFRDAFVGRKEFFQQIGFKRAKILHVEATPLDKKYTMAKVHWQMTFEKHPGQPLDFKFFITYFLYDPGTGPRAASWISHEDEQSVMREAGLIPVDA